MATFAVTDRFWMDYGELDDSEKARVRTAIEKFVSDLNEREGQFRAGLRVKGIRGAAKVFEMTWAPDGRATFQYGASVREGEPHIIWRRIGKHSILLDP
jgi:hypothetical protein